MSSFVDTIDALAKASNQTPEEVISDLEANDPEFLRQLSEEDGIGLGQSEPESKVTAPTQEEFEGTLAGSANRIGFDNDLNDINWLINYLSESSSFDLVNAVKPGTISETAGTETTADALNVANKILHDTIGIKDGRIKRDDVGGKFYLEHPIQEKDGSVAMKKFDIKRPGQPPLIGALNELTLANAEMFEYYPIVVGVLTSAFGGGIPGTMAAKGVLEKTRKARVEKITGEPSERKNTALVTAGVPVENVVTGTIVKGAIGTAKIGGSIAGHIADILIDSTGSREGVEQLMKNASKVANKAKVSIKPVTDWISVNVLEPVEDAFMTESKTAGFFLNLNNKIYSKAAAMQTPQEMKKVLQRTGKEVSKFFTRIRGNKEFKNAFQTQTADYLKSYVDDIVKSVQTRMPTALDKALSGTKAMVDDVFENAKGILPSLKKLKSLGLQTEAVSNPMEAVESIGKVIDDFDVKLQAAGDDLLSASDDLIKSSADDIQLGQTIKGDMESFLNSKKTYFQNAYTENYDKVKANPTELGEELSGKVKGVFNDFQQKIKEIIPALKGQDDLLAQDLQKLITDESTTTSSLILGKDGKPLATTVTKNMTDEDIIRTFRKFGDINIEGNYYKDGSIQNVTKKASRAINEARAKITSIFETAEDVPQTIKSRLNVMKEQKAFHDTFDPDTIAAFSQNPKKTIEAYKMMVREDPSKAVNIADSVFTSVPDKKVLYKKAITEGGGDPKKIVQQINKNLSTGGSELADSTVLRETGLTDEIASGVKKVEDISTNVDTLTKGKDQATKQLEAASQYATDTKAIEGSQQKANQMIMQLRSDLEGKRITPEEFNTRVRDIATRAKMDPKMIEGAMGELPEQYKNLQRQSVLANRMAENYANPGKTGTFINSVSEYTNRTVPDMVGDSARASALSEADKVAQLSDDVIGDFASGQSGAPGNLAVDTAAVGAAGASGSTSFGNFFQRIGKSGVNALQEIFPEASYNMGKALNTGALPASIAGRTMPVAGTLGSALRASSTTFTNGTFDEELERSRLQGAL